MVGVAVLGPDSISGRRRAFPQPPGGVPSPVSVLRTLMVFIQDIFHPAPDLSIDFD